MPVVDFQLNLNTETVDDAFPADPICVQTQTTIREVFEVLKQENRGCALVCQDDVLVGIFTERDALKLMADQANLNHPIESVMRRDPVTLSASETVGKAISKMSLGGYRRLPIVDDEGRPTGLLKVPGILHYLVEHFPSMVYNLPPAPHHSTQQREGA
ncbi:MAG: CBS domain-containing protein [Planctomycetes bacterium]|nr:CBS domain-containing protein [Planctomycetota bacterium]